MVSAIGIFNLVAPQVFALIASLRNQKPDATYEEILREAGVKLDAEAVRLLADMAKAVQDGAIPH